MDALEGPETAFLSAEGYSVLTAVDTKRRLASDRFHWVMAGIAILLLVGEAWAARQVGLSGFFQIADCWFGLFLLAGVLLYSRWRQFERFVEACWLAGWAVLMTNLLGPLMQIAGRAHSRLADASLAHIDAQLHFSTGAIVHWVANVPALRLILAGAYELVLPLILAALLVPVLSGRTKASRRYILSITFAALITAALFCIWPAIGPWTICGFAPTKMQADVGSYLTLLKTNSPVYMNPESSGIVSFPSFHVVLALLSAIALWGSRRLRWFVLPLAVMICLSTLTTGWHYLIDVIGGLVVTFMAHTLSARVVREC
jgi:membrane-associated phospholipid phosphatase